MSDTTGPAWPFPEAPTRNVGGFDRMFGIGFILAGMFTVAICAWVAPLVWDACCVEGRSGTSFWYFIWVPFLGVGFVWAGISSLKSANRERENAARLARAGRPCWGRISATTPGNTVRKSGVLRWIELRIIVDAFAADTGELVRKDVLIHWYVSELQVSLTQPGHWCAFMFDGTNVDLYGFATPEGRYAAAS